MNKVVRILKPIILISLLIICIIYTYSLEEYVFESKIYIIENNYIKNISPNTNINIYKEYFDINNCTIKVFNNEKEINKGNITTGTITKVYNDRDQVISNYTNIIKGDINKDGLVNKKDLEKISYLIINEEKLNELDILTMDMNNDSKIRANDIALLQDYLNKEYEELTLDKSNITLMSNERKRLKPTIKPNIIKEQNLIWRSSNEIVASVTDTGIIIPHSEGTSIITATTKDLKLTAQTTVTVDNTIKLQKTSGKIYIGGSAQRIYIKSIDYNNLTCESSNISSLECIISDKYLELSIPPTVNTTGEITVTVKSKNYGTATYTAIITSTYVSLHPPIGCIPINSAAQGIISSFNAGTISINIIDKDIVKDFSINKNRFTIKTGSKASDTNIIVKESNGNAQAIFNAIVYKFSLDNLGYKFNINDEPKLFKINNENTGNITCSSEKEEIATCEIENNYLKVTPKSKGMANIEIQEDKCHSKEKFLAVVTE